MEIVVTASFVNHFGVSRYLMFVMGSASLMILVRRSCTVFDSGDQQSRTWCCQLTLVS